MQKKTKRRQYRFCCFVVLVFFLFFFVKSIVCLVQQSKKDPESLNSQTNKYTRTVRDPKETVNTLAFSMISYGCTQLYKLIVTRQTCGCTALCGWEDLHGRGKVRRTGVRKYSDCKTNRRIRRQERAAVRPEMCNSIRSLAPSADPIKQWAFPEMDLWRPDNTMMLLWLLLLLLFYPGSLISPMTHPVLWCA